MGVPEINRESWPGSGERESLKDVGHGLVDRGFCCSPQKLGKRRGRAGSSCCTGGGLGGTENVYVRSYCFGSHIVILRIVTPKRMQSSYWSKLSSGAGAENVSCLEHPSFAPGQVWVALEHERGGAFFRYFSRKFRVRPLGGGGSFFTYSWGLFFTVKLLCLQPLKALIGRTFPL